MSTSKQQYHIYQVYVYTQGINSWFGICCAQRNRRRKERNTPAVRVGGEKIAIYARICAPENQVTNCVSTPPVPRKGVYQDVLGCLGAETS